MITPARCGPVGRGPDVWDRLEDPIHEAVVPRLLGGEPAVPVRVPGDGRELLPGVFGNQPVHHGLGVFQVLGLELYVDRGALDAGRTLVHQDPRVRQGEPLAPGAGRQQELPHAGGDPHR